MGSWLCESLLQDGHNVICVDNLISGNKNNIKHLLQNKRFLFAEFDVIKPLPEKTVSAFGKLDRIYHLASPASPNINSKKSYMNYPVETMLVNSAGTYHLLEIARKHKAKLLYASSSEVYGEPEVHPQTEDYFGNVNSFGPRSCYDEAKRFGEAMVYSYIRKYAVSACVVRIFNTYGPRMDSEDGRVISNFITQALKNEPLIIYGKGTQTRSFCFVSDLIKGLKLVMDSEKSCGEVINLGNDEEYSIMEVIMMMEKELNRKLDLQYGDLPINDPTRRKPSLKKAYNLFGYKPEVALEEGIRKTITYFEK